MLLLFALSRFFSFLFVCFSKVLTVVIAIAVDVDVAAIVVRKMKYPKVWLAFTS